MTIAIRVMRAADKPAVLAFCRNTFEWGDYIDEAFDHWLDPANGDFLAAEVDGRVVGIVHIGYFPGGQAWLEGLRVDPAYRGRGVARALSRAEVEAARRRGCRVARSMVAGHNAGGRAVVESIGLRLFMSHAHLVREFASEGGEPASPAVAGAPPPARASAGCSLHVVRAEPGEVGRACELFAGAALNRDPSGAPGLMHDWAWEEATPESLMRRAGRGELVVDEGWDAVGVLAVDAPEGDLFLNAGDGAAAGRLAAAAADIAARGGCHLLFVTSPIDPAYVDPIVAAGFTLRRRPEGHVEKYDVFEMQLDR